ncbi:MAG TPA: hypothetical protein VIV01_19680 [Hyphomicrobiaceae bacterium]
MSSDVDAVIAALRVVLHQAEHSTHETWWKIHVVNKWIDQLPGAWRGKWRQLRLRADVGTEARRDRLVTPVRATLAYLETNRDAIAAQRPWWSLGKAALRSTQKPAMKEVPGREEKRQEAPRVQDGTTKPKWLN